MNVVTKKKGFIAWFVNNPVAANLLMAIILVIGFISYSTIRLEAFPVSLPTTIMISVPYNGGTPEIVEDSVVIKIEQALSSVEGVKSINATASAYEAVIFVEKKQSNDIDALTEDIQTAIDNITTFPKEAETPIISSVIDHNSVVWVSVQGAVSEFRLKETSNVIRNKLLRNNNITHVDFHGYRDYQINIYLSVDKLQQYGLTFNDIAEKLRASSLSSNAGKVTTDSGDILLSVDGSAHAGIEYAQMVLRTGEPGETLYLRDVAQIDDGFSETSSISLYNGSPAIMLEVKSAGPSDSVKAYNEVVSTLDTLKLELPTMVNVSLWNNSTQEISDRLSFLTQSGIIAMCLVILILSLFLDVKLALWVAVGVPISFAGAFIVMSWSGFDFSLNIVTLFAFIIALGIVVDDAIIIGESIYSAKQRLGNTIDSTIRGVRQVALPATFGVLTTIAAFWPLTMISSYIGQLLAQIAWVVIFCLSFSLVESKLILPAHLRNTRVDKTSTRWGWRNIQSTAHALMNWVKLRVYREILVFAIRFRYFTVLLFVALLLFSIGLLFHGHVKQIFFPDIEEELLTASFELNNSLSFKESQGIAESITRSLRQVSNEIAADLAPVKGIFLHATKERIDVTAELESVENREYSVSELSERWHKQIKGLAGIASVKFREDYSDIDIYLYSHDLQALRMASQDLENQLTQLPPVNSVVRNVKESELELTFNLTTEGRARGINNQQVASQVRHAFQGLEVQRLQAKGEEVEVILRLPNEDRRNLSSVHQLSISNDEDYRFPLSMIAEAEFGRSLNFIDRDNGERVVSISADVDKSNYSPEDVVNLLESGYLSKFEAKYPKVRVSFGGDIEEGDDAMIDILNAFLLSILLIYILLAIPLRSYFSPIIILSVIPFGLIGVIAGHIFIGIPLSILSFFGFLALSGVVVNDSLILVVSITKEVKEKSLIDAVINAANMRFRAVVLTSLTTFFGLAPIIFETSYQAQILVPTAVSLGFGIIFSTLATLVFIPCVFLIFNDIKALIGSFGIQKKENLNRY